MFGQQQQRGFTPLGGQQTGYRLFEFYIGLRD